MNPRAQMRDPITLADHQASRWIAEPLHLLDCCLVSNGGIAVIVTSPSAPRELRQPPVHVLGCGQGHPGYPMEHGVDFGLAIGARQSGATALRMAGHHAGRCRHLRALRLLHLSPSCVTLEDYGFCAKGEGGPFAATANWDPAARCRPTPAAASCRAITCGA